MVNDEKLQKLLNRNTFFTKALPEDEQTYRELVTKIVETLKRLKEKVTEQQNLLSILADFLQEEEHGLNAVLTLSGLSSEKLYRIISFLRFSYYCNLVAAGRGPGWQHHSRLKRS